MAITISTTNANQLFTTKWIQSFREKHGHAPRVLHIGNIANNAYNNAKLLNKAGLDCDVICYDYYHIMGCPEWEDADFEGEIKDQFFPDWRLVDLKGFKRPKWFTQGPLWFCINYLIAKRDGKMLKARLWWNILEVSRCLQCSPRGIAVRNRILAVRNRILAVRNRILAVRNQLRGVQDQWFPIGRVIFYLFMTISSPFLFTFYLLFSIVLLPIKILKFILRRFLPIQADKYSFDERVNQLVEIFAQKFPERKDKLLPTDLKSYQYIITLWKNLFSRYDIVQGYSTDPILPLLAAKPYFAFEHGTLREIPFEQTSQGRMTALSYHLAEHVFITNADCMQNAHILANDRVSFISHPYDEDHGLNVEGWQDLRQKLYSFLDADFLFFFPTRHDWVPGTGYADKANDTFLQAFCRLHNEGYKVGIICCRWGANVQQSKILLKEKGCSDHVHWVEPMGTVKFERMAKACNIVVDQFKLGSFGGVMFKAMAIGSPICTYLDETEMRKQYGEIPPVINCQNEHEIVARMKEIIENPAILEDISVASRNWIKKYYNSDETIKIQLLNYKKYLEARF